MCIGNRKKLGDETALSERELRRGHLSASIRFGIVGGTEKGCRGCRVLTKRTHRGSNERPSLRNEKKKSLTEYEDG